MAGGITIFTYGIVVKKEEYGGYVAQAPDFIECFGYDETLDGAIDEVKRRLAVHIGYWIASGTDLPEPTKVQSSDGEVVYVSVEPDEDALKEDMGGQKINMFNCPVPTKLKIGEDYSLLVSFDNDVTKNFDLTPYIEAYEVFEPLKDRLLFEKAILTRWGIIWNEDIDIAIEEVYESGKTTAVNQ